MQKSNKAGAGSNMFEPAPAWSLPLKAMKALQGGRRNRLLLAARLLA